MTTNAPKRPVRRNIAFNITDDHPIARIESIVGEQKLAEAITGLLNRYLHLIARNSLKVSDREFCLIIEALGDNWRGEPHQVQAIPRDVASAITDHGLDTYWSVDGKQLSNRLERSSVTDRTAIAEYAVAFQSLFSAGEMPQTILGRIRDLIQPAAPTSDTQARPRRISPVLFDRGDQGINPPTPPNPGQTQNDEDQDNGATTDIFVPNPETPAHDEDATNSAPGRTSPEGPIPTESAPGAE